ncbi:MAG: phosphoribosylformylglycinamidine synthase subunit PurQ [Phycisphaerales bacterium]
MPKALVIRAAGTNCDQEMVRAFTLAGAETELVHLDRAIERPEMVGEFDLLGFPGGFSYGDDVASGRIYAMRMRERLWPALRDAAGRGCPMIAACNGFQILVQSGLLPGPSGAGQWPEEPPEQETSLAHNAGGRFIDRWVGVRTDPASVCIWTRGLEAEFSGGEASEAMMLPIAHGEGRFVVKSPEVLARLQQAGQVALRYGREDNPNGSTDDIAGICDATGRIFGLMPHPERYLDWTRHPFWTRLPEGVRRGETPGLRMFRNAVAAVAEVRV